MRAVQPFGTAPGTPYHNGDPMGGSGVDAAFFNVINAEMMSVLVAAGMPPSLDDSDLGQLAKAICKMISAAVPNLSAYLRKDTSAVLEAGYWTKPVPLAIAAGIITPDLAAGNVFTATATINLTLAFPAGLAGKAGMMLVVIAQDATGGRTLTLAPGYKLAGGSWSTTANAVNLLWVTSDGSGTALDVVISQRGV